MIFSRHSFRLPLRRKFPEQTLLDKQLSGNRPLLEIENLSFAYDGSDSPVLEHVSLSVREQEFVMIQGISGCGKSTLLRLLCRLNAPSSGKMLFRGRDITELSPPLLRSMICFVGQLPQMIDASILDNLLLPFSYAANSQKEPPPKSMLIDMLRKFYLQDLTLEQSAAKLSVGQKQRLALMRALLPGPELLLLDEPTSALDRESAAMVFSIIERLNRDEGKSVITVTHSDYAPASPNTKRYLLRNRKIEPA